jgi:hypothetical protein
MKDGKCPKCNSNTVYVKRKGTSFGDGGIHVYISSQLASRPVPVDHYICTTCGYFEAYVEDKAKLEAVTKDWKKVD